MLLGKAWDPSASTATDSAPALSSDKVRAILAENDIDVVVYHWGNVDKESSLTWAKQNFGLPAYQDTKIAIFEIPKSSQKPSILAAPLSSSGWCQRPGRPIGWVTRVST